MRLKTLRRICCWTLLATLVCLTSRGAPADPGTRWWSLEPVASPAVPRVDERRFQIRNPIDAFIATSLAEKGLSQSPEAGPRTLIRRLYFDLIGLPPTPEEVEAFVNECGGGSSRSALRVASSALEQLVDRLLVSPRYGERWARHWMDVVHFAETHGHDQDRIRTNAWPYRDYLIESFNADKPYARFVKEQLAADAFYPEEPKLTVALGFIAAGPWDESSLRDIRDDSIDRQIGYYLDRDDMVTTAMSTFTSTTVHCARCHDHKFDPIPQRDYYALQAVFAGVGRANVAYDTDPKTRAWREGLRSQLAALEKKEPAALESLLRPEIETEVTALETKLAELEQKAAAHPTPWTVLKPMWVKSDGNATFTSLADGSFLAGGPLSETETYKFIAYTDLEGITGVRLETLTDPSLPKNGPGRKTNGNFHLSELLLKIYPKPARPEDDFDRPDGPPDTGDPAKDEKKPEGKTIHLTNATARFSQEGFDIRQAADGNTDSAWGIFPQVGRAQEAWFELTAPVGLEGGTKLKFFLQQFEPGHHLIGRFRLSITTSPLPVRLNFFPPQLAGIIAAPRGQRTPEQRQTLAAHYWKDKLQQELATLPSPQLVYAAAGDFLADGRHKPVAQPRPVYLLKRGDINKPGEAASPGALTCIATLPARFTLRDGETEAARRSALAGWIASPENPLTWRSIVNRVWHYHFGRGLVDTPNDFGRMGSLPTHPALLDWLAAEFRQSGGSFKQLHRLIVTSATYRQSSVISKEKAGNRDVQKKLLTDPLITDYSRPATAIDADNRFLWRMNRTRLDAESYHDAVLQVAGRLDLKMGGPSVQQFALTNGVQVTPVIDYTKFDWDRPGANRRSVYRFIFRTLPDPFMDALDCADASQLTAARNVSVTALQALAMLNNQFIVRSSEHFAERLTNSGGSLRGQINQAFLLACGREPTMPELIELKAYAAKHGLANLCRLIFNSNEFLFVN